MMYAVGKLCFVVRLLRDLQSTFIVLIEILFGLMTDFFRDRWPSALDILGSRHNTLDFFLGPAQCSHTHYNASHCNYQKTEDQVAMRKHNWWEG